MKPIDNKTNPTKFGYTFHAKQRNKAPGYPGVEVVIRIENNRIPGDIKNMTLRIAQSTQRIEEVSISHPTIFHGRYIIVPGRITLYNQKDDTSELFTLGGHLQVEFNEVETKCFLTSTAPIIDLDKGIGNSGILTILAEEIEDLFEIWQARLLLNRKSFMGHLLSTDPLLIYMICLDELLQLNNKSKPEEKTTYGSFSKFLKCEIENLQDEKIWPSDIIKSFEDLIWQNSNIIDK